MHNNVFVFWSSNLLLLAHSIHLKGSGIRAKALRGARAQRGLREFKGSEGSEGSKGWEGFKGGMGVVRGFARVGGFQGLQFGTLFRN